METVKDIVDFIEKERGERIPESRVKVWHKNGLLPRPEKTFGGQVGSRSGYPEGTKEQALVIYDKLKDNKTFDYILMEFFLEKRKVDIARIKEKIVSSLNSEQLMSDFKNIIPDNPSIETIDDTFYFIQKLGPKVLSDNRLDMWAAFLFNLARNKEFNQVFDKRTVNEFDIEDALHGFASIWFNADLDDDNQYEIFQGMANVLGISLHVLIDGISTLKQILNKDTIANIINNLTTEEITQSRDDFITIQKNFDNIIQILASLGVNPNSKLVTDGIRILNTPTSPVFAGFLIILIGMRHVHHPDLSMPKK